MDLNTVWFVLIAVLYTGFFVLEGFDFGVGILLPFLGKDDRERRVLINTIGPHWDANEVWLITAGGATFASFPHWYATLFSGFYLPLFLILLALIVRGAAFEFRSKGLDPRWRQFWDGAMFVGSLVAPLLLGVAFANLARGVPINENMQYVGGFWNLLNPYALLGGLLIVALCVLNGAVFLSLKTAGKTMEQARAAAARLWLPVVVLLLLFAAYSSFETDFLTRLGVAPGLIPLTAVVALLLAGYFVRRQREGWAFGMIVLGVVALSATLFLTLYPRVMISSLNPAWSLTIYNASSSAYTLRVMTIVALIFTPIALLYQGWSYWVFRQRIGREHPLEY